MTQVKRVFALILALLLCAILVFAANIFRSPSICSGGWTTCTRAFANDALRATANANLSVNVTGQWREYNISLPANATIKNVTVRTDFFATNNGYLNVRVSWDGGTTFGAGHIVGTSTSEKTYFIDVINDTLWNFTKLNNANFRVNATCFYLDNITNATNTSTTCSLDWIPVNVTWV